MKLSLESCSLNFARIETKDMVDRELFLSVPISRFRLTSLMYKAFKAGWCREDIRLKGTLGLDGDVLWPSAEGHMWQT